MAPCVGSKVHELFSWDIMFAPRLEMYRQSGMAELSECQLRKGPSPTVRFGSDGNHRIPPREFKAFEAKAEELKV
jgi:hypothetical protein